MKNSIKKAQSQASLDFAEQKNFRPLAKLKKLSLTLALLITAVAGAWAEETVETTLWEGTYTEDGVEINSTTVSEFNAGDVLRVYVTIPESGANFKIVYKGESNFWTETTIPSMDSEWPWLNYGDTYMDVTFTEADITALTDMGIYIYKGDYSTITKVTLITPAAEPDIAVTTNAASAQDLFTTASFTMPASDVTVNYTLVRDMQDETNPVAFSGLPITLDAFLADMTPGYYWIKAESTDENSTYDGTVYSSQFTVVEQYDLLVKPADDFSKGKIESVTVGSGSVTPDATTGEATKTGVAPDTEVKLKAKRGYVIEKVEAGKTVQN